MTGSFGAHGLQGNVSPKMLAIWQTATHYQLVHALALLGLAFGMSSFSGTSLRLFLWSARLFVLGTVVFSGTLYIFVLTDFGGLSVVTPIGGGLLILGWLVLVAAAIAL